MTWPTKADYIERGASLPTWAGGYVERPDGPRACWDCSCSEDDHAFGDAYRAYAAQVINDGEARRDGVNVCLNCQSCGRNEDGE